MDEGNRRRHNNLAATGESTRGVEDQVAQGAVDQAAQAEPAQGMHDSKVDVESANDVDDRTAQAEPAGGMSDATADVEPGSSGDSAAKVEPAKGVNDQQAKVEPAKGVNDPRAKVEPVRDGDEGEGWTLTPVEAMSNVPGMAAPELDGLVAELDRQRLLKALFGEAGRTFELGRYVVMGMLGRGGMGVVFKAFDPELDRRVALKVLNADLDRRHTTRLRREAQALAKLSHPNVVQVYEVGHVKGTGGAGGTGGARGAEGQTFVAMELVQGRTLKEWMRQDPRPS